MTRKELTDIICPIKICKCWMPRWFYDLECNSKLWIVTHDIWAWVLKLLWCLHDPKGIDGWWILFVPLKFVNVGHLDDFMILRAILDYELSPIYDIWALFVPLNYDALMTRKELMDIICPIKICKCWMPRWFYDLECNSRLWIVTHMIYELEFWNFYDASMTRMELTDNGCLICLIKFCKCWDAYVILCNSRLWIITRIWYMSLSFEIIMMPLWPERNWRILFVPLKFVNVGCLGDFMILSAILDYE